MVRQSLIPAKHVLGITIIVRTVRKIACDMGSLNCSVPLSFVNVTAPSTWFPHAVMVSSVLMIVYLALALPKVCIAPTVGLADLLHTRRT